MMIPQSNEKKQTFYLFFQLILSDVDDDTRKEEKNSIFELSISSYQSGDAN